MLQTQVVLPQRDAQRTPRHLTRSEGINSVQGVARRDLIVRVAGDSARFCDLSQELLEEIIARTEHQGF